MAQTQTNQQAYGIVVAAGSSNNYTISGNRTSGNVTGGISDNGTGTHKTIVGNTDPSFLDPTILTGGNVGIGTASPGYTLQVNGTAGDTAGGSWASVSDERLKTDIQTIAPSNALTELMQLNPVTFDWINPGLHGDQQAPGGSSPNRCSRSSRSL